MSDAPPPPGSANQPTPPGTHPPAPAGGTQPAAPPPAAGSAPPPAGGPPTAVAAAAGGGKAIGIAAAVIAGVVVIGGGAALAAFVVFGGDDDEVLLEAVDDPGPDPFMASAAPPPDEHMLAFAEQGAPPPTDAEAAALRTDPAEALVQRDGHLAIEGSTPGLYGGTNQAGSCDPDQIAAFLADNPTHATAWAEVHGIDPAEIPTYLDTLTPMNLGADTRVLNHGFAGGSATPREAVLQRGTSVLVDAHGVPRVKCECGNPLREPNVRTEETYAGERWQNFREDIVIVVERAPREIRTFELTDVRDGRRFERPAFTRGEADVARDADPADETIEASDGCGFVTRRETGDVFDVIVAEGDVDCEEANIVAHRYVNGDVDVDGLGGMGTVSEVDGWTCAPATAAQMDFGVASSCERDGTVIEMHFDTDEQPEPDTQAAPGDGEFCGNIIGALEDLGDAEFVSTGFGLYLRGPGETCDIAHQVAEDYLEQLADNLLTDGILPYETDALGWQCTSGDFLGGAPEGSFFGCSLHNAEIEFALPQRMS